MRRFFYGISVVLFLCLLSLAYYGTYQWSAQGGEKKRASETLSPGKTSLVRAGSQETGGFWIREEKGQVLVYEGDGRTLYETAAISMDSLPKELQRELKQGKYVGSIQELYSFLENYSS